MSTGGRRPTTHRHATAGILLLILFGPASADGQSPPSATAEGRARFNEGVQLADAGDHEGARLKFDQAWTVLKLPAILFNLARSEQLSGHLVDALLHYRLFAKMTDPKIAEAQRQQATRNISELSKKVGQLDIQAPRAARVTIDGRVVEPGVDPIVVTSGAHIVEALVDGKVRTLTVEAPAGTVETVKLAEEPPAAAPSPPAPIGEPAVRAPHEAARTSAGWILPIGLGTVGAAALAAGAGFALSSQNAKDDAEALRRATPGLCAVPGDACARYDGRRDDASSDATVAWVGYISGGVLVAAALATFVFWPRARATSAAARRPSIGIAF